MKIFINTFIIVIILFIIPFSLNAQSSINIDAYGTFLVQDGLVREIPSEYPISSVYFWENYLILYCDTVVGFYIYNIETEAISRRHEGTVNKLERNSNNLIILFTDTSRGFYNWSYWNIELEKNNLTVNNYIRVYYDNRYIEEIDGKPMYERFQDSCDQWTSRTLINERTFQYSGKNYFLNITYGNNIDLRYEMPVVEGGVNNIFVVLVNVYRGR